MNEARDLGIEISEAGLPISVCSHPNCPLYLQPLGPAPITGKSDLQVDKFGSPVCTTKTCRAKGKAMKWFNAKRATRCGFATNEPFFFACLLCKAVVCRPGAGKVEKDVGRKYLYFHLSPLFVPDRQYVRSLHMHARGLAASSKKPMPIEAFVQKMLPLGAETDIHEWIQLLQDLYPAYLQNFDSIMSLNSKADWTSTLSPAAQQDLQKQMLSLLNKKRK